MISSENELETNTLACSWNESGSSSSKTSESSNSESDKSKTRGYASSEEYKQKSSISSNKKSSKDTRLLKIPTNNINLNAFFAILQSMVNSFTHTQPKEVFINGYNMINAEFIVLKDPVLNHFTSNFSDKEREKFWHEITLVFSHIL
ncbi:gastrula zinc finger protein xlcgf46.1 [Gigaspora margarita]|uniref:Gastrula zinc finger protein xlcgf46.1 n=1 Tax=Gigaspora margarita TaxID=4874 RepID=A0A8H4AJQ9_GIGMA|nr:gastrula zinc finger protein xlcgf46.1 [Gigaspora margarita]